MDTYHGSELEKHHKRTERWILIVCALAVAAPYVIEWIRT